MATGRLTVIQGCMFSGKSERVVQCIEAARHQGRAVAAFKHASDDRYAAGQIVTHSGRATDAVPVSTTRRMLQLSRSANLVVIDEAQFFGDDLVDLCRQLVADQREVVVAGLDLDSWGLPFGPMPALAAMADEVVETRGTCARCGQPADHTQRLVAVQGQKMVGGPDSYEPRCAACFAAPSPELRR